MCFRVGALGEFVAFAFNLLSSYLPVAGCNLIVFSSEPSLGEFTTVRFEFAFESIYFRGIKDIDILVTCVLCLYLLKYISDVLER